MASIAGMTGLGALGAATRSRSVSVALRAFLFWLPVAFALTVLAALVYLSIQQDLRMGANDPQIQMAEDTAAALQTGTAPGEAVGKSMVDVAGSLAPFLIIYDDTGRVAASSAQLSGQTPDLPPGVLNSTRAKGENRITWQPRPGVRIAAVITRVGGTHPGYVLAGRSLREVEKRIEYMMLLVGGAWLAGIAGALVITWAALFGASKMEPGAR